MKFNKLIPELMVSSLKNSLNFYLKLGFKIEYERHENKFFFLSLEGSQIMLQEMQEEDDNSDWYVGKLEYPLGRGLHFQIEVKDINPLLESLKKSKYPIKEMPKDYWFRKDNKLIGMKGFLVQDPDGYLFFFNQNIGEKNIKK